MSRVILYISYDGILEPLGQSQVLRYLERLASARKIVLISFEKPEDWQKIESREALRAEIQAAEDGNEAGDRRGQGAGVDRGWRRASSS